MKSVQKCGKAKHRTSDKTRVYISVRIWGRVCILAHLLSFSTVTIINTICSKNNNIIRSNNKQYIKKREICYFKMIHEKKNRDSILCLERDTTKYMNVLI